MQENEDRSRTRKLTSRGQEFQDELRRKEKKRMDSKVGKSREKMGKPGPEDEEDEPGAAETLDPVTAHREVDEGRHRTGRSKEVPAEEVVIETAEKLIVEPVHDQKSVEQGTEVESKPRSRYSEPQGAVSVTDSLGSHSHPESVAKLKSKSVNSCKSSMSMKSSSRCSSRHSSASKARQMKLEESEIRLKQLLIEEKMQEERLKLEMEAEDMERKRCSIERRKRKIDFEVEKLKTKAEYETYLNNSIDLDNIEEESGLDVLEKMTLEERIQTWKISPAGQDLQECQEAEKPDSPAKVMTRMTSEKAQKLQEKETEEVKDVEHQNENENAGKIIMNSEFHQHEHDQKVNDHSVLRAAAPAYVPPPSPASFQATCIQTGYLDLMRQQMAPSAKLESWNGEPLKFRMFMANFTEQVESCILSPKGRLIRLISHLEGEPKITVEKFIFRAENDPESAYREAKEWLWKEYGNLHTVSSHYTKKLYSWPIIKAHDGKAMREFYLFLMQVKTSLTDPEFQLELNTQSNLREVVGKLPTTVQDKWNAKATSLWTQENRRPRFSDLQEFVEGQSQMYNNPSFSREAMGSRSEDGGYPGHGYGSGSRNHAYGPKKSAATTSSFNQEKCEICERGSHQPQDCEVFKKMSTEKRFEKAQELRLCFRCLGKTSRSHYARVCHVKDVCSICGRRHHTLLHENRTGETGQEELEIVTEDNESEESSTRDVRTSVATSHAKEPACVKLGLPAVQVKLYKKSRPERSMIVYCFPDTLSNGSFIDESIRKKLEGESRKTETFTISTMTGEKLSTSTPTSDLIMESLDGKERLCLPKMYSQNSLPVRHDDLVSLTELRKWDHLKSIESKVSEVDRSIPVGLVLGQDVPRALQPQDVISGDGDEPYAMKTRFGWTVCGPMTGDRSHKVAISSEEPRNGTARDPLTSDSSRESIMSSAEVWKRTVHDPMTCDRSLVDRADGVRKSEVQTEAEAEPEISQKPSKKRRRSKKKNKGNNMKTGKNVKEDEPPNLKVTDSGEGPSGEELRSSVSDTGEPVPVYPDKTETEEQKQSPSGSRIQPEFRPNMSDAEYCAWWRERDKRRRAAAVELRANKRKMRDRWKEELMNSRTSSDDELDELNSENSSLEQITETRTVKLDNNAKYKSEE